MRIFKAIRLFLQMMKTPYPPGYNGFKLSAMAVMSLAWYLSGEDTTGGERCKNN